MAKRLPLIIALWLLTDIYFSQAVGELAGSGVWLWVYWLVEVFIMTGVAAAVFLRRGSRLQQRMIAWLMGLMLLAFIPRLLSIPFLLVEDITRLFRGFPPRARWVSELTLG